MQNKDSATVVYQARLHWVIFLGPSALLMFAFGLICYTPLPHSVGFSFAGIAVLWECSVGLTYHFSFLNIKQNRVVMCSGIIVRQTLDIPMNKIESIDIRQSILGSILQYGSLLITGTGGTRQYIDIISKPLTCRRYIEELMHDIPK